MLLNKCNTIKPRIIDIAPTVLYHMGLPIIDERDGTVLAQVIRRIILTLTLFAPIYLCVEYYSKKSSLHSDEDEEKIHENNMYKFVIINAELDIINYKEKVGLGVNLIPVAQYCRLWLSANNVTYGI